MRVISTMCGVYYLFEGGACDNNTIRMLQAFDGFISDSDQPVPAVGVCEWNARGHFLLVGGRMEL